MNAKMIVWVAFGGAAGSIARYLMMSTVGHFTHPGFPYATLVVNILGGLILGGLIEAMALAWSPSPELRSFIVIGVLGGFTTFSTFSLDAYYLFERGQYSAAGLYIAASIFLSISGVAAGMTLLRQVL